MKSSLEKLNFASILRTSKNLIEKTTFQFRDEQTNSQLYVSLKLTDYEVDGEPATMVQIIDVSASIHNSMQKTENRFLSMINACVSHELRNPLNSIIA